MGPVPVGVAEVTGTQFRRVDARGGGEDPLRQFLTAHLQGEEECGAPHHCADVDQYAESESRFTGARARPHDRHAARLQSLKNLVERLVARFQTVDSTTGLAAFLEDVSFTQQQALQGRDRVGPAGVADGVDLALGFVDQSHDVFGGDIGLVDDLASDRDESALLGLFSNQFGVVLGVRGRRRVHLERREQRQFDGDRAALLKFRLHGHVVDRLARVRQRDDGTEDLSVQRSIEVFGLNSFVGDTHGLLREQHGADQTLFGFDCTRRYAAAVRRLSRTWFRFNLRHKTSMVACLVCL